MSLETSLAETESVGQMLPGGRRRDSPLCFPACQGLGPVAALLGQDGEVAEREMAVDTLVDAAELVGTLQRQDSPPADFGLASKRPGTEERQFGKLLY